MSSPMESTEMEGKRPQTNVTPANEQLYNLSFFHKDFAGSRKLLKGVLLLPLAYNSLVMWGCLSLYYGSLLSNNNLAKLTVYAVDLDGGFLGQQVIAGIKASQQAAPNGLDWRFDAAINSSALSQQVIRDERAWTVLQVSPNASANLDLALTTGLHTYNPLSSMTLLFASARNQITTSSKVVPAILAVINPIANQAAIQHTAMFLERVGGNNTALNAAKSCPQCLVAPFGVTQTDLIPFNNAPAMGSTMVGMIFLLTFSFSVFNILRASAVLVGSKLNLRSILTFRTVIAFAAYLSFALWYTLINLAFGVPMNRWRSQAQGFLVYWMLNTFTMASVGLPMESLFTIIGERYSGYFLTFWIIVNVSGSFVSQELMPGFYRYGWGFPFYNSIQGARTIVFGTKSHLGQNFGVLFAWMVVGWIGVMMFTTVIVHRNRRKRVHDLP